MAYNTSMRITVLFFAGLAERAGCRSLELPHEPGDTVASVRDRILAAHPALEGFIPNLMYAVNEEYAREGDPVPPGATLALIPPVSGG